MQIFFGVLFNYVFYVYMSFPILQICLPVLKPSSQKLCLAKEKLTTNDVIQDMIDDGDVFELGLHPLPMPRGCWGIVVETESEHIFYYISEEIKAWHLYFFRAQLGVLQQ